jgi:hypothetical protein
MDLIKELNKANTTAQCLKIANTIGNNTLLFSELTEAFLNGSWRINQRATKPLMLCIKRHPLLLKPHLATLLTNVEKPHVHIAAKRNTLRILQEIEIPKPLQGKTATICFDFLNTHSTPIAAKVFAMTVLCNIALVQPELKNELRLCIEHQMPLGSAGFVSRGRKIILKLNE